jgi:hypothetical protein
MSRLYYKIWADAIQRYWKHHPKQPWKLNVFLMMTWMHTLNAFIVALWLKYFDILVIPILEVELFPGNLIDAFLSFAITFSPPFILVNYFFIFYKNRYEKIVERHKDFKYNYAMIYSLSIVIGAFVSAVLYGLLK